MRGLEILDCHGAENISVGNDEIYVGGSEDYSPEKLGSAVASSLDDLGWFWDSGSESWVKLI